MLAGLIPSKFADKSLKGLALGSNFVPDFASIYLKSAGPVNDTSIIIRKTSRF